MPRHNYPHAIMNVNNISAFAKKKINDISGVRYQEWNNSFLIPHHAIEVVSELLEWSKSSKFQAYWVMEPMQLLNWKSYSDLLRLSELHDWVLDGFLTEYQSDAIEKTGHMRGCHFWHPTGAGKTLSAIMWSLLTEDNILIITRAASRIQYGREIERFTSLKPYVMRPLTKKRSKTLEQYLEEDNGRKCVVVAWEAMVNNLDALQDYVDQGCTVVFDESHRGKSSKRWKQVPLTSYHGTDETERKRFEKEQLEEAKKLGGFIKKREVGEIGRVMIVPNLNMTTAASLLSKKADRVLCTTATPIKDRVRDLWAQLDLAEPFSWGSATEFMKRYCNAKPNRWGGFDTTGSSNMRELSTRLKHCTHKIDIRDTHRNLPDKRRQSFYISPEDQCRATGGFAMELREAKKIGGTAMLEVRLAQASSMKRRAILDLIADHCQSNHKVVVFTGRRRDVESLRVDLGKHKVIKDLNTSIWSAHGGVSSQNRQALVDEYMAHSGENGCVLIGTGDSFGESLNLQDTDAALFTMLPYTVGQIRQWEGRFCRLGQKRPVCIYYCIAEDTVDEHIADILLSKFQPVEEVIGDVELAEARHVIGGIDNEDAILDSILSKFGESDE